MAHIRSGAGCSISEIVPLVSGDNLHFRGFAKLKCSSVIAVSATQSRCNSPSGARTHASMECNGCRSRDGTIGSVEHRNVSPKPDLSARMQPGGKRSVEDT
jgi:hypothetical protein